MAKDNFRLFAPGVRVAECWHANVYFGSAEALVSTGLVRANQLPGQPGMAKSCVTFYDDKRVAPGKQSERDEKFLRIQTAGKKFNVTQGISKEAKAERQSVIEAEWKAAQEAEQAAATSRAATERAIAENKMMAKFTLSSMPTSPNDYRKKLVANCDLYAGIMRDRMTPKKGSGFDLFSAGTSGFSMDESIITEFNDLVNEIRDLISNASVQFNAKRQNEIISNCKSAVARGDAKFQRVLAGCIE